MAEVRFTYNGSAREKAMRMSETSGWRASTAKCSPAACPGFWPRPRPPQRKSLTVRCSGNRSRCSSLCSGKIFAFAPVRKAS
jgi:hypothetical protein